MDTPMIGGAREVAPGTHEIASWLPVPGLGILPVNTFVIRGEQPMLVDTGLAALREPFLAHLGRLVDPSELRWIWMSHMDPDHLGNLAAVLELAPEARVITSFLGMGKMMLHGLPVDRVHLLEAGGRIDTGDRELVAMRPPYYDAPETSGFFDTRTRVLFSADAFGALLQAPAETARDIPKRTLRDGMLTWSAIDAPWLKQIDPSSFERTLRTIERLDPSVVIGGHLPSAPGMTRELTGYLAATCPGNAPIHEAPEDVNEALLTESA